MQFLNFVLNVLCLYRSSYPDYQEGEPEAEGEEVSEEGAQADVLDTDGYELMLPSGDSSDQSSSDSG